MYPVSEVIKYLPDDKSLGFAAKYHVHLKHFEDLHWSVNENVLPDSQDHETRPHSSKAGIDQTVLVNLI